MSIAYMTPGRQLAPRPDIWGCLKKSPPISALAFTFSEDLKLDFRALRQLRNREAELEASIMGGKLYLAAYAQRLGASGLTFFNDDITDFFSPHAAGKSVMFLIALGKSVKKEWLKLT
jgi:hypothetical protein